MKAQDHMNSYVLFGLEDLEAAWQRLVPPERHPLIPRVLQEVSGQLRDRSGMEALLTVMAATDYLINGSDSTMGLSGWVASDGSC